MIREIVNKEGYAHIVRIRENHYAIRWAEESLGDTLYECNLATWQGGYPTYPKLVSWLIRHKYTADDEFAIARQTLSDTDTYTEYSAYVQKCKKWAHEILGTTYTPDYMPTQAEVLSQMLELMKSNVEALSDADAINVPALFTPWKAGENVTVGIRRYFDTKLYKCVQAHTTQVGWEPDKTPALWVEVSVAEIREITDPIPAENPFMKDEKGRWKGEVYVSQIDNNTWTPEAYPAGWVKID